ncbi:MAG: UbiA family prenyltransferase [bacterium]
MTTWRPWFRLFRLPNLLTAPGDPLAGFVLASAGKIEQSQLVLLLSAMGTSLFLYLFGLAVNDIVDVEVDRAERPERPLPAGEITLTQARMAAIAAVLSGLNVALFSGKPALIIATLLAAAILFYNAKLKYTPIAGALAMGICRGLSLLIGVAAAKPEWFMQWPTPVMLPAVIAAIGLMFYVATFTALARHETEQEKPMGFLRWVPFLVLLIALPSLVTVTTALKQTAGVAPTVFVFLMCMALMRVWLLGGPFYRFQAMPVIIGGYIRNLLMVQACFCVSCGVAGLWPAMTLLLLFTIFPRLSKSYYSS